MSDYGTWLVKRVAVCPQCHALGCLEKNEFTGAHRCVVTGKQWEPEEYHTAVSAALAHYTQHAA